MPIIYPSKETFSEFVAQSVGNEQFDTLSIFNQLPVDEIIISLISNVVKISAYQLRNQTKIPVILDSSELFYLKRLGSSLNRFESENVSLTIVNPTALNAKTRKKFKAELEFFN